MKQTLITHPTARSEGLLIETVGDETVIFDLETRASHALKPLAAAVFAYADGANTPTEIAELASYRLATTVTETEVTDVVEMLRGLDLIESNQTAAVSGLSRRDALKTFAAIGAGAALITTVSAGSAMAATGQAALGDDQGCVVGTGHAMVPSAGTYANYVFPEPGTTSYKIGSYTFYGLAGNASYGYGGNSNAVDPRDYGASCKYLSYNGGDKSNPASYSTGNGKWQCIPCDGPNYQCCQVVCGPSALIGYGWGASASPPPGYSSPYTGCGWTGAGSGCPNPGQPDFVGWGYPGKYCTSNGGKPGS